MGVVFVLRHFITFITFITSSLHHHFTPSLHSPPSQYSPPYRKDNVTTGASSDLQQASSIARGLVYEYGMMGVRSHNPTHH